MHGYASINSGSPGFGLFFPEAPFSVSSQKVIDGEYPHPQPQKMC